MYEEKTGYRILPPWNAFVAGTLFGCDISQVHLADEMGVSRQFLNSMLHKEKISKRSRSRVETALKKLVEEKGATLDDYFPAEKRSYQSNDP